MSSASENQNVPAFGRAGPAVAQAAPATTDEAAPPIPADSRRPTGGWAKDSRVWAVCGFLVVAVGLVFGQTIGHGFIGFDDQKFVSENEHVTDGLTLSGLWWALTDGWVSEWCPVTHLSHQLDCQLYALWAGGHHLTNVLLHATSSVLLFLALLRMTGQRAVPEVAQVSGGRAASAGPSAATGQRAVPEVAQVSGGRVASAGPSAATLWPSAWVAAVFAVHPLHVESVAWVAERRDMLSGLFFMLVLLTYARYAERPSLGRYLPVFVCLALGLMSKAILVTVPCVLLLLDFWPLGRFGGLARQGPIESNAVEADRFQRSAGAIPLVLEKIPLVILSAISCAITMWFHSEEISVNPLNQWSLWARLANALIAYAAYLGQSFFPIDLALFYPARVDMPVAWVAGAGVLLAAITAIALRCWRSRPYLPVGWFWFLGMLVPVCGLMPVGGLGHARADRYTYLSQIGLSIAIAWTAWSVYRAQQALQTARWRQGTLATVSAVTVLGLAVIATRQTNYWRDGETLWSHAVVCAPPNYIAQSNLGLIYSQQGRIEEAIAIYREAMKTELINAEVRAVYHMDLGDLLYRRGDFGEAITNYQQTVRLFPSGERGHTQLAIALATAGRLDEAAAEWREALRLVPDRWGSRVGLAEVLLAAGKPADAAAECRQVLDQEPGAIKAIVMLGTALAAEGDSDDAVRYLQRAVELDPGRASARFQLGLALNDLGRFEDAADHLNAAVRLEPDNVTFLWQTAWILASSPDESTRDGLRAVELAKKAVKLSDSQDPRALDALAAALAENGEFAAAVKAARQASTLALTENKLELSEAITQRMRLYRDGQPYRQPPAKRRPPAEDSPQPDRP